MHSFWAADGWHRSIRKPSGVPGGFASSVCLAVIGLAIVLFVAPSGAAAAGCPNEALRTGPSSGLPDCRAYEQATPTEKGGSGVQGAYNLVQAAESGGAITYFSEGGIPGGKGSQNFPNFLSRRGASAWDTRGTLPSQTAGNFANLLGYTPDLEWVLNRVGENGEAGKPGVGASLVMENTTTGVIETIVPFSGFSSRGQYYGFDGASSDVSRVFFDSTLPLTGETPTGQDSVYVWNRSTRQVTLASVLPNGEPAEEGAFAGPYNWFEEEREVGGSLHKLYVAQAHAVATDGDKVYFTAFNAGSDEIYLRKGLVSASPETVAVSASRSGTPDPNGPQPAAFAEATPNGRYAFFLSSGKLTDDATTGTADEGKDLYRFDASTGTLTDLVVDTQDPAGAEVQGVLGSSEDGSVVYFVANGVLGDGSEKGATLGNCANLGENIPRHCNLYRYSESAGQPKIRFIGQLNGSGGFGFIEERENDSTDWAPTSFTFSGVRPVEKTARVSADGDALIFASTAPLTGYNNLSPNCPGSGEALRPCSEIFRYDAATDAVSCLSCDPSGAPPFAEATFATAFVEAFAYDDSPRAALLPRNLSADGDRLFFQSPDALVPEDTNGAGGCTTPEFNQAPSCQDVYEWEAVGSGGLDVCSPISGSYIPSTGGCISLISTGQGSTPSWFAGADKDGKDVFFFTRSQLVPDDRDQLVDVYDAREGGGLESQQGGQSPVCIGEACQGAVANRPSDAVPGSSTLVGPGNQKQPKKKNHKKKHHAKKKHQKKSRKVHHKRPSTKGHQQSRRHGKSEGSAQGGGR